MCIYTHITLFGIEEPNIQLPPFPFPMTHTTYSYCLLSYFGVNTLRLDYIGRSGDSVCLEDCMKHGNSMCERSAEFLLLKLLARAVTIVFSKRLNGYS